MTVATRPIGQAHVAEHAHGYEHDDTHGHGHVENYAVAWRNNRMGLWLFFLSEAFLFGGMLATRFFLWGNHRPETDQIVGLIVTAVLLLSSYTMNMAETGIEHGDRKMFLNGLVITAVLGLVFLFGVLIFEWGLFPAIYEGHLTPWGDMAPYPFGAVVFLMTGMHALHVLSGLAFIAIVWNLGRKGHFSAERHWGVESCAIYWHFVDLVWIFFYPAIYLIGEVVHH